MQTRRSLAIVAMMSIGFAGTVSASPITYDFTGVFPDLVNGSRQFSGALTINGDPAGAGGFSSINETGSAVSLALTLGGQTFNIVNQSDPSTFVSFGAGLSQAWIMNPTGPQQDEALILSGFQTTNALSGFDFSISFYSPTASDQLSDLRNFSFPLVSGFAFALGTLGGSNFQTGGEITSFDLAPTPTPEPGTLAIFAVLAAAAMTRVRRS